MAVQVDVSGVSDLRAALSRLAGNLESELGKAVEAEADAVVQDARSNVRVLSGDLRDSITAEVSGLSAEVRPRSSESNDPPSTHAIKANVNEFGRASDPGSPYMVPAAEASRARWPTRAQDAAKRGARG